MDIDEGGLKLCELRVIDLRNELQNRGLDKTGVKADLTERLKQVLVEEDKNPDTYVFTNYKLNKVSVEINEEIEVSDNSPLDDCLMMMETPSPDQKEKDEPLDYLSENIEDEKIGVTIKEEKIINNNERQEEQNVEKHLAQGQENFMPKEEKNAKLTENITRDSPFVDDKNIQSTKVFIKSEEENSKGNKNGDKKVIASRSLWITNLLPTTRAQELRSMLSKYGKVIGAKIIQRTKYSRNRCYGYVTLVSKSAADTCIQKFNNTEFKGQIIQVTKVKPEHNIPLNTEIKNSEKKDEGKGAVKTEVKRKKSVSPTKEKKRDNKQSTENPNHHPSNANRQTKLLSNTQLTRKSDILTFDKIRDERERYRHYVYQREIREKRKRLREIQQVREMERRHREEVLHLERERNKIRIERERLDRKRKEIIRLEEEQQRNKRVKLEQELIELRRQRTSMEKVRRSSKRPPNTSTSSSKRDVGFSDDRKRLAPESRYSALQVANFDSNPSYSSNNFNDNKNNPIDYKSHPPYSKRNEEYTKQDYTNTNRHQDQSSYNNRNEKRRENDKNREKNSSSPVRKPLLDKGSRYVLSPDRLPNAYRSASSNHRKQESRSSRDLPVSYRPVNEKQDKDNRSVSSGHKLKSENRTSHDLSSSRLPISYRSFKEQQGNINISTPTDLKSEKRSSRNRRYSNSPVQENVRYKNHTWYSQPPNDKWNKLDNARLTDKSTTNRWVKTSHLSLSVSNTHYSDGRLNTSRTVTLDSPSISGTKQPIKRVDTYKRNY